MDRALAQLLSRADDLLAGRPVLQRTLRDNQAAFIASPLPGLRPQQRKPVAP